MNKIKKNNLFFWTKNPPGIGVQVRENMVGTKEHYKKIDEKRYSDDESYFSDFDKILKPSLVSLEVGCGLGSELRTFARAGLKVTGLDYSPENAYRSKMGLEVFNLQGRVVAGDAECLPFPDESFDLVYSWGVLHHTPDTQKGIDELYRVLHPGGTAMVMLYKKGYQYLYFLFTYILKFKWLKKSLQDYISYGYDYAPLSQMFSLKQMYSIFKNFEDVNIRVTAYHGMRDFPVRRVLWRLFKSNSWLMRRLGSFGIILAHKPGDSLPITEFPEPCCPLCHSSLVHQTHDIKCENTSCGAIFPVYKGKIPIFHPPESKAYQDWMEHKQQSRKNINLG